MKKALSIMLIGALTLAVAAPASATTLRLVNGKIEVDVMLKHLAEVYQEETGVEVQI